MTRAVEIIYADGTSARFPLDRPEVTVGSAPGAAVRIDEPSLEAEHLLLAPQEDGCWVGVAQGARSPAYVDGSVFSQGVVPWGTSISVGPVTLRPVEEVAASSKPSAVSLPVLLLALIGLPLGLWMLMTEPEGFQLPDRKTKPPALFGSDAACPEKAARAELGEELSAAAVAKAERYAFEPADGIEAVELYRQAAACLEKAGNRELAARLRRAAKTLQGTVEEDYKTHRVRLRRALDNKRYDDALLEAKALLHFVGEQGNYSEWLRMLVRRIEMRGTKK